MTNSSQSHALTFCGLLFLILTGAALDLKAADYGLSFDGVNDYVTFGPAPGLGATNFTIETWFNRQGAGATTTTGTGGVTNGIPLVTKGRGEADASNVDMNYFLGIRASDNVLVADFEEGATGATPGQNHPIAGVTPIVNGIWYHAAATYDGTKWQLFLNGNLEAELTVGQPPRSDSIQHAGLGTALNSTGVAAGFFNGVLDEARIWNYARSAQQIADNKNVEIASAPGLIGRWGLNEGNGVTAGDSSGNAINGALTNGPAWVSVFLPAGLPAFISQGATWRYFKGTSFPSGWTTNGFNDSGWATGPSGFGYGDGDDATVLNDMTNTVGGYVSVFIRKTFNIPNPATVTNLTLAMDYDDGFVAYINGTEVARRNVTNAVPNNTTLAAGNHEASRGNGSSDPQEREFITLSTNVLVAGTNVIAISGHNVSTTSSDLTLIPELYTGMTLVRGPFIQMPDSNALTVVWRTDALADSVVDYGLDTSYAAGTVSNGTLVREHVVNIPGLLAGSNYYYRVGSGGVTLWQGDSFRTKRDPNQTFRFVAFGDFGQGTPGMSNVATRVNATDFDLLLTLGDNIYYEGQPGLFDPNWFSIYAPTMRRVPTFPAIGNHDVGDGDYSGLAYLNNFYLPTNGPTGQIERNYSFDYGNAHFVTIDSNPSTNPAMNAATITAIKSWLSNDLAATSKPWKFVYFHHPPYISDGGHTESSVGCVDVRTNMMPVIEAAGAQMVLNGHQHWYERMNVINGVYHIVSGAGGGALSGLSNKKPYSAALNNASFSFSLVDVGDTILTLQQIDTTGNVFDTFKLDRLFKINSQPTNQTTCNGGSATFSVAASGTGPASYQWRKLGWSSGNDWQLSTSSGNGSLNGFFIGTSALCGNWPGIDNSGRAFGLYANSGGSSTALRNFPSLGTSDSFALDYKNPRDMVVAGTITVFGLHDSSGVNRFELYFRAGDAQYTINDANTLLNSSGIPYTSGGLHVVFTLVTADTYNLTVTRLENNQTFTFTGRTLKGTPGSAISRVRLYYINYDTVGGSCRDFFVNNLSVGRKSDNASDSTYASGWSNGQNGGVTDLADGGNISGATNDTLTINPATTTDAGAYNALVSSAFAQSAVSSTVTPGFYPVCLTITAPPDLSYTTNSTILVTGTTATTSSVAGVTVNGVSATSGNGFATWTATITGLAVGTNTLTAVAADGLSHSTTNTSRVIFASGSFDGNGDGLPDAWQMQYFGSPDATLATPAVDADGDGLSNLQEYLAGTDPTDGASAFRVTSVAREGNDVRVIWTTVAGKTNALQAGGNLAGDFVDIFAVTNTVGPDTNYLDLGAVTNTPSLYYRVRLVP